MSLIAVLAALVLAVASCSGSGGGSAGGTAAPGGKPVSASERARAALVDCPAPSGAPVADSPLRGLTLNCLSNGSPMDLTAALAGKPALLNLWAYWCGPCAEELPLLQQFSDRASGSITVLTVHSDPGTAKGLARLTGLGIHLPGVEDPDAKVRTAVGAPAVLPISVLLRADGSVAKLVVRPFKSVDDISDTVAAELGVRA
ncbi:TlpA family protein disulfide reductase [Nocardia sp. NPDC058058]|uniref:TlpA family protein disulfide reductase n=1 Tax=Nocardia sp. NPDC058058 TaxID=3346317 RepID=UPI0036D92935